MEEIAEWFRRDLQRLLDMYKYKMSVPIIMNIAQDTFHKTFSVKEHPELHSRAINYFLQSTGYNKLKPGNEPNAFSGPNPICSQGPDGCCATYKSGWDACKGCTMYHGGIRNDQ